MTAQIQPNQNNSASTLDNYTSPDKLVRIYTTTSPARWPRHGYPVVIISLNLSQATSRIRTCDDGSIDYIPTFQELESTCSAIAKADPGFRYALNRGYKVRTDSCPSPTYTKKRIDDSVGVEIKNLETSVALWRVQSSPSSRVRQIDKHTVEFLPSFVDLSLLLELRSTTDPYLNFFIDKKVQPKPLSRKQYWQTINATRHAHRGNRRQ